MNVAVVGVGYWGKNYVRILSELGCPRVVACDSNLEMLELVRAGSGSRVECESDLGVILGDATIDAVVVVTPAGSHHAVVRACLQAGKHVLVEKPLTLDAASSLELCEQAASAGVTLMVGHTFLFNSKIKKLRALTTEPGFGTLYYMSAKRTNLGPVREDTSVLWDLAPHDVSIFQYLMGCMPERVSATGQCVLGNEGREDVVFVTLFYPGKVVGHVHVSWVDPNKAREVVVVGSNQRISCDDMNNNEPIRVYEKGVRPADPAAQPDSVVARPVLTFRDGDILIPKVQLVEPLKEQTAQFLDGASKGVQGVSDGKFGWQVVLILEAAERSLRQGGVPEHIVGGDW